ncbi:unnamed protein product [Closterium sp. NIES-54]
MASLRVLTFDHEGRPIQFDTWIDDLQLYLLSDSRDSVLMFHHTSGDSLAPPATPDSATCSQWLTHDAAALLAIRNHLPLAKCAHFGQHKTAKALYDAVVARYSSPATAALGRLLLPYLFPELSAFAIVEDLVTHLRTCDARYRAALPAKFLDRNPPPMDHLLALDPTDLTVDLLEQHLLAVETSVVAVGAARGTPRTPIFEGCFPSPLAPSYASAGAVDVLGAEDVGAASARGKRRSSKGKGGRSRGGGSGGGNGGCNGGGGGSRGGGSGGSDGESGGFGGGGGGSGESSGIGGNGIGGTWGEAVLRGGSSGGQRQQQRRSKTPSPQQLREWFSQRGASGGSGNCPYVIRTGNCAGLTCGKPHTQHRYFSRLDDALRAEFGDEAERPRWVVLLTSGVAIFDLDYDAILADMYALSVSAEGDYYMCVSPDPGIEAAALGASKYALPGTAPAEALHTFMLDSVSLLETSPTLRWTGKVGDASVFWVWGSFAFVRDTSADKLYARAIPCVFLGFPPDAPGWRLYHPTSHRVLPSRDITFNESVPFYRLFPYRSAPLPPPPLFLALGPPPVDPLPHKGLAPTGVSQVDLLPGTVLVEVTVDSGPARGASSGGAASGGCRSGGAEPRGAKPGGAEPAGAGPWGTEPKGAEHGGAEFEGAESGGAEPRGTASSGGPAGASPQLSHRPEPISPQKLREWFARRIRLRSGAAGAGDSAAGGTRAGGSGAISLGGAVVLAGAGGPEGAGAAGPGGACTRGTRAAGAGGVGGAGAGGAGAGDHGAGGTRAGGARGGDLGDGGAGAVDHGAGGAGAEGVAYGGTGAAGRVPLLSPPASSLADGLDPVSDLVRAASPTVPHLLATVVTDPSFESAAASALVAELVDFAPACRLDYATSLTVMDVEMASWKSTCTYVDAFRPPGANIVDGMWIFRVKRPPGSPATFMARYVAQGFSHRQGVDFFETFSPTQKMTTFRVLLHVAAQCDFELQSLDFNTAFLQGGLDAKIWLRRPPGFTGLFPAGTQWSLQRPVYGLCHAPCKWQDTVRTTLAALGFIPSTTDPSLFLCTDTSLPLFSVLVYVDNLVFATADTEALALVKLELQKRHTCTDLGELRSYLGLQITRDRTRCTITLTRSHMVHQVLQRFGFRYSSPQSTPLPTGHSLSAPPSDKSVEPNGSYPELVSCLIYLMTCTRHDLAYPLSILERYVALGRHRLEHSEAAKRVLHYLCSTLGMWLVLGGRDPVVLTRNADASWLDDLATQRSSDGYTFSLGSGSVSWRSTRSSLILSSRCEAEIYARAMAAQELRWLTYLLTDLGERPRSSPVFYIDNKAMIALCKEHRLEHKAKHIALRYFLTQELQQHDQLHLAYVATVIV